jgi:hypothetical protein
MSRTDDTGFGVRAAPIEYSQPGGSTAASRTCHGGTSGFTRATGAVVDLTTISPGQSPGKWAGATGQLRISWDLSAGMCKSEYNGTVQHDY